MQPQTRTEKSSAPILFGMSELNTGFIIFEARDLKFNDTAAPVSTKVTA